MVSYFLHKILRESGLVLNESLLLFVESDNLFKLELENFFKLWDVFEFEKEDQEFLLLL